MGKASRKKKIQTNKQSAAGASPASASIASKLVFTLIDWIFFSVIFNGALIVYSRTLCPTIFTSGTGENVTAVALLGVPHPPGFPLFCLLGKIFTYVIPFGRIAFRVNFFSALCGAGASAMLYVVCRTLLGPNKRFAAAAAALLFAFSHTFWSQAVIAEVYTLNALMLLCIFYLLLRWEAGGSFWLIGLFVGLGLTVHPLQALFFPGWLYFIIYRSPRRSGLDANEIGKCLLAFVAAIGLHLYPLVRSKANPALDWGNPENFKNLIAYLTASQYQGRMFSLPFSDALQNAVKALRLLLNEFTPWLVALPVAGAVILFKKHRRLFVVTLLSALLIFIYAINYNIPWEIDVYYIPVALISAFWTAWLFANVPKKIAVVLPLIAAVPLILNFHNNDRSKNRIALEYGIDLLISCPPQAHLLLPQTDAAFSVLYLTAIEHLRSDLNVWVHTDNGVALLRDGVNPDVPPIPIETFLPGKENVFQAQRVTVETVPGYNQIPDGVVYRLVTKNLQPPHSPVDFRKYRLEKYTLSPPSFYLDDRDRAILASYRLVRGDTLLAAGKSNVAMQEYFQAEKIGNDLSEIRSQLAIRFADLGNKSAAIAQLRKSIELNETAGDQNRLGRLLVESGRQDEALAAFLRAIKLDPNLAIAHSNLGALLGLKGDMARAVEELEIAVKLDPRSTMAHNNLALAYLKSGRRAQAVAEFQTSLNLDPTQQQVKTQLSELKVE
jgi:tetratricopeptide (TPR) repeat protein